MFRFSRFVAPQAAVCFLASAAMLGLTMAPASTAARQPGFERVVLPEQAAAPARSGSPELVDDRARGLIYSDLVRAPASGPCQAFLQSNGSGLANCTHGPDPADEGVDVRTALSTADLAAASTSAVTAGIPCFGDGTSGKRVQVVYAHAADVPDRYAELAGLIGQWMASVDLTFDDSAAETGGSSHVRWVTDPSCNLVVERVQLSTTGDDSMGATSTEMRSLGFNRTDRKYLLLVDSTMYCGIADIAPDDRLTADNANNIGPSYARVDSACWGRSDSVEAHELMHTLGGVQLSSPHSSGGWHCTEDSDRMCYPDTVQTVITNSCPSTHERLFDCNHDDYFHTAPAAGSYLSSHWNTATSAFLESADPATTSTTVVSTTSTTVPSTTSTTAAPPPSTTTTSPKASTVTSSFSSTLNKNATSRSFSVTAGSGTMVAKVTFSKASSLTLTVRSSAGVVVGQTSGGSPTSLSVPVSGGPYSLAVSGTNASFTLTVSYPAP